MKSEKAHTEWRWTKSLTSRHKKGNFFKHTSKFSISGMNHKLKRVLRHVFGWSFLVLGIMGLFLPFLQGFLFIIVGISILAPEIPLFHSVMVRLEDRYPKVFEKAHRMKQRLFELWEGK